VNLVPILQELGIGGIRQRGDEISALCPMHLRNVGRQDRNASWGINAESGLHQCFSCGYKGTFTGLYLDLTGSMPGPEILAEMVVHSLVGAISSSGGDYEPVDPEDIIEEWDPGDLIPLSEKMLARRFLTAEAAERYGVCFDRHRKAWFLPICTENGELVGAQYKWADGETMNEPYDVPKGSTLFGLLQAATEDRVLLVESPLDVVRLHVVGIPAVSSYGAMVSKDQAKLLNRYFSVVVLGLDNDPAGHKSAPIVTGMLRKFGCPTLMFDYSLLGSAKDPGDVEDGSLLRAAWESSLRSVLPI
jgi:hypothetical protein